MKVTVDTTRLRRKLRAAQATELPRRAALVQQTTAVTKIALDMPGKNGLIYDTGRWRAALAQAANEVGAGPFVPATIREGRLNKVIVRRAVKQYTIAQARVNWYDSLGPLTRSQQKQADKARRWLDTAKAYLERVGVGKSTIAVGLFGNGPVKTYDRIYGGRGYFIRGGSGLLTVALHNMEPHASLVEWRYKVMRLATSVVGKLTGMKQVKSAYVRQVLKATNAAR